MISSVLKNQLSLSVQGTAAITLLGAFITAFAVAGLAGKPAIKLLMKCGIFERTDKTPIEDKELKAEIESKKNIPTMGGLIIGTGMFSGILIWGNLKSLELWLCVACFAVIALFGSVDDYLKIKGREHGDRGVKVRYKLLFQFFAGITLGGIYLVNYGELFAGFSWPLPGHGMLLAQPLLWLAVCAVVIAVLSNAVNVADGMDGLAGGLSVAALMPLAVLAAFFTPHGLSMTGTTAVFCASLSGAITGFLWYNIHPAMVFMGDTGSMAIGAGLGLAALISGFELLLPVLAFVFLIEFGSSVLQVLVFQATGRRIFAIAPIHHIFQQKKWPETHTVGRFWIAGAICSLAAVTLAMVFVGV